MKKLLSCLLASIMMLFVMVVPSYDVHAANVSLSVSSSSVDIGDTVTVTASVPGGITAKVDIYFSTGLFEFVSASGTTNQNGGTVATTLGEPFSSSITVKLKAKTTGTGTITASVIQAGDSNTGDATTLGGAQKSVTIENKVIFIENNSNMLTLKCEGYLKRYLFYTLKEAVNDFVNFICIPKKCSQFSY